MGASADTTLGWQSLTPKGGNNLAWLAALLKSNVVKMNTTRKLQGELWRRFGTREYPAEWDGYVYGGGKLSQRYWEYFAAIELLDLDGDSVVVDIGGGSPVTGVGFFASLLATAVKKVIIFDSHVAADAVAPDNVQFERRQADYDNFKAFLQSHSDITHLSCISVFEHIPASIREGIMQASDEAFAGNTIVATLEFHARRTFFEHQLTAKTLSDLFKPLTRFFPDRIESSPVWAQDAFDREKILKWNRRRPLDVADVPRWYPLAMRFVRL